jgi:hypothetical protein
MTCSSLKLLADALLMRLASLTGINEALFWK